MFSKDKTETAQHDGAMSALRARRKYLLTKLATSVNPASSNIDDHAQALVYVEQAIRLLDTPNGDTPS